MSITKVELLPIRPQNGLMAFACVEIDNQFYVNSIGVHKRRDGKGYRITYPTRKVGEQNLKNVKFDDPSTDASRRPINLNLDCGCSRCSEERKEAKDSGT